MWQRPCTHHCEPMVVLERKHSIGRKMARVLRSKIETTYLAVVVFVSVSLLCACGSGSFGPGVSASSVTLKSIQISPSATSISVGQDQQFTAIGHYSDESNKDITESVLWTSSNSSIAQISSSGVAI